jgi:hypothetical protein
MHSELSSDSEGGRHRGFGLFSFPTCEVVISDQFLDYFSAVTKIPCLGRCKSQKHAREIRSLFFTKIKSALTKKHFEVLNYSDRFRSTALQLRVGQPESREMRPSLELVRLSPFVAGRRKQSPQVALFTEVVRMPSILSRNSERALRKAVRLTIRDQFPICLHGGRDRSDHAEDSDD